MSEMDTDPAAEFSALYAQAAGPLQRWLLRKTGEPETAAELMQESFARAWAGWGRFTDNGRGRLPWLRTIARNLLTDWYRHRGVVRFESVDAPAGENGLTVGGVLPAQVEDAGAICDRLDRMAIVRTALTPAQLRIALEMFWLGYGSEEIGASNGIAEATVRVRVFRLRAALRAQEARAGA